MNTKSFALRHIGIRDTDLPEMLLTIGDQSVDELLSKSIPDEIRLTKPLNLPEEITEYESLEHIRELSERNDLNKSYIGLGYYKTILPPVIQRNILENPGWYTAYTPYQAEIAQGRLEALLNFQTMVTDLTALPISNASLLDEATAAAEAMYMLFESRSRDAKKVGVNTFFISDKVFPQTVAVVQLKAESLGIEIVVADELNQEIPNNCFGILLQYPNKLGEVVDYTQWVQQLPEHCRVVVAADILSLTLLKPPGEWGAAIAVGSTQRFGIPMGYGGPHAAYLACTEDFKRFIPGRLIGVSKDLSGNMALRMALQTREQHIKRERATSNICTAQVLLAVMAGMYAVYHGADGLKNIAKEVHQKAQTLASALRKLGYKTIANHYFDTVAVELSATEASGLIKFLKEHKIFVAQHTEGIISFAMDEGTNTQELSELIALLSDYHAATIDSPPIEGVSIPGKLLRQSAILEHEVFNSYRSETELMRYIKRLERKDLSLNHSMIPLGSCTMKLNAAAELIPLSWSRLNSMHPFLPAEHVQGYRFMIEQLEGYLSEITGFAGCSLQPNSGAQGEYTGLMLIREYLKSKGEMHRNIALIPDSAHGTNPASAVLAGMEVVVLKTLPNGQIDGSDLDEKLAKYGENLACLMVTYPSTFGVFDANIRTITRRIHENGGQIYMDGANMNAQVGLTSPATIGADVCHLNLHKTFAIPHGGGGPGVGPVCVAEHLVPFLPNHQLVETGGEQSMGSISAAPFGSALIHFISYAYIRMLGAEGLTRSTSIAILSANYLKSKLEHAYPVLYQNEHERVAHEFIIDCRPFKKVNIEAVDIAKRLMDYGFHAPTVSFPVAGTLMIEPTESESKSELDRFVEAMLNIRQEIEEIIQEQYTQADNVLKNAPHTLEQLTSNEWNFAYARQKAAYPLPWVAENKFWPSVRRIDEAFGDRNLICTCPAIEEYATVES